MVYERYIKKGGKVYGPYKYHSKKENGKVVSNYIGKEVKKELKKKIVCGKNCFIALLVVLILILISHIFLVDLVLTGKATLSLQEDYFSGESISGNMILSLQQGELIPLATKVLVNNGGEETEYLLSDLVEHDFVVGNFYAEERNLSGNGLGYGIAGGTEIYPDVNFVMKVYEYEKSSEKTIVQKFDPENEKKNKEKKAKKKKSEGGNACPDSCECGCAGNSNNCKPCNEEEEVEEMEGECSDFPCGEGKVYVCHKPGTSAEGTLCIDIEDAADHLDQGGYCGECEEGGTGTGSVIKEKVKEDVDEIEDENLEEEVEVDEEKEKDAKEIVENSEEMEVEEPVTQDSKITGDVVSVSEKVIEEIPEEVQPKKNIEIEKVENGDEISEKIQETEEEISKSENADEISEKEIDADNEITGKAVEETEGNYYEVKGIVSKNSPFIYSLGSDESAKIILADQNVNLKVEDGAAAVTTDYSISQKGFGKQFVGQKVLELNVDLEKLNLTANQGSFSVSLVYQGEEIVFVSKEIQIAEEDILNLTLINETTSNETIILEDLKAFVNTTQYGAVVGMPVKWKKNVKLEKPSAVNIKIPREAKNITIYKIEKENALDEETSNEKNLSENISNSVNETIEKNLKEEKNKKSITGDVVAEIKSERKSSILKFFKKVFNSITGHVVDVEEKKESLEVVINDTATDYEIEYETPGPKAFEKNISLGKEVTISSEISYKNILAYTELPKQVLRENIKLYHVVNNSKIETEFTAYDSKGNLVEGKEFKVVLGNADSRNRSVIYNESLVNKTQEDFSVRQLANETNGFDNSEFVKYITWVVPHLSNQTYEIIIEIVKAEHLDENRSFIDIVYDDVKAKDGNWTSVINDSQYVRVVFEENLTDRNDITIYARGFENETANVEIYVKDENESFAIIKDVSFENWHKTYLTELNGSYDTFDLKVNCISENCSGVEFDYIVDPFYLNQSTNGTEVNVTTEAQKFSHLNISDGNLVAYYPFDYPQENATWVAGMNGTALDFDGANDYVNIPTVDIVPPVANNYETYSLWFKWNGGNKGILEGGDTMVDGTPNRLITIANTGKLRVLPCNNLYTGYTTNAASKGIWNHFVWAINGTNNSLYLNGNYEISGTSNTACATGNIHLGVGYPAYFNGSLDEVLIFNRTLNASEINQLYTNNVVLNSTGLAGQWHLDDGTGFNAHDSSGNSNYGELKGYDSGTRYTYDYTNQSNDGTATGGASPSLNGIIGGAYTFDGVDDYVSKSVSNFELGDQTGSISFWIKTNENSRYQAIFSSCDEVSGNYFVYFGTHNNGKTSIVTRTTVQNSWIGTSVVADGNWHNIIITSNESAYIVFVDGNEDAKTVGTSNGVWFGDIINRDNIVIGARKQNTNNYFFNGSVDEIMVFNRTLNSTEVAQIYSGSYERFEPTGEMLFEGLNFASNNTVNITFDDCQTLNGSYLQGKINSGSWKNFSGCSFTDYPFSPTGSDNFTARFLSTPNNFYSPLVIGNISLNEWTDSNAPAVTINSPDNVTYGSASVLFNATATESISSVSSCWYSIDGGVTNQTLSKFSSTNFYNYTNSSIPDGQYTANFYCNDSVNNINNTENILFAVDTTKPVISFIAPTQTDGGKVNENFVIINTTIIDTTQTSAWVDWDKSLVGYWGMDFYNSTGLFDNSSYSNYGEFNGVNFGASNISNGVRGNALSFDGIDDYVALPNLNYFNSTQAHTYSAWVYPSYKSGGTFSWIINNGDLADGTSLLLYTQSSLNAKVEFYYSGSASAKVSTGTINYGTWNNVVVTYLGNKTGYFYINGNFDSDFSTAGASENWTSGSGSSKLGALSNLIHWFNGSIDEAMIFNRTLSASEIQALYDNSQYRLTANITGLTDGQTYNYSVYAIDTGGNLNITSPDRQVVLDATAPTIAFANPTPTTGTIKETYADVNVSVSGANSTVVDWNNSLISWWRFEGGLTDTKGDNDGTNNGATHTYAGRFGEAYDFDGVNDYVNCGTDSSLANIFDNGGSVSSWIYVKGTPELSTGAILDSSQSALVGYDFATTSSNGTHAKMQLTQFFDGQYGRWDTTNRVVPLNQWIFASVVYNSSSDSNDPTFYIGDVTYTVGSGLTESKIPSGTRGDDDAKDISIGNRQATDVSFFGSIDEVMIFNRTLSLDEIFSIYNATRYEHNFTGLNQYSTIKFKAYSVDDAGNLEQTNLRTISIDYTNPLIHFTSPTPNDGVYSTNNYATINASVTDGTDTSVFVDWDKTLVGYWGMDFYNSTGLFDNSSYCYDNETEILTNEGWKYFYDLNEDEEVATLNSGTGELEWQLPAHYSVFDNENEMYKIILEDGSDLLVSENHKVYSNIDQKRINKDATNVASKVKHKVLTNFNYFNYNNYINFSININSVVDAPVASKVMHQSNKLGPNRHSGSNPDGGATTFSLRKITEVYSDFENGEKIYFLNSENEPLKVVSILKENYNGRIYDVDVENDIVLVRRKNGTALWSGNSNYGEFNGVNFGTSNISNGARGSALSFDGVDDRINFIDFENERYWTASAWINYRSCDSGNCQIVNVYKLCISSANNKLIVSDPVNGIEYSNDAIQKNIWTHIATSCDNDTLNFYINGVLNGSVSFNCTAYPSYDFDSIGASASGNNAFNGSIDEVLIFNRTLSSDEILALYNSSANNYLGNFTGLIDGATYNYSVYVIDAGGNLNITSPDKQVTIDLTIPQVTITSPTSSQSFTSASVTLSATTSENSTCEYSLDAGVTNSSLTANATGTGHSATRTLSNANYVLNVYCDDLAGNENNTESVSFSVAVPASSGAGSSGSTESGGGGGASTTTTPKFSVGVSGVERTLALNRIEFGQIPVTNNQDEAKTFTAYVEVLDDVVSLEQTEIVIGPGETKNFEFKLIPPSETGIYTGKIIIYSDGIVEEILTNVNVKTEKSLFDISVIIPKQMKEIKSSTNLNAQIDLTQMGIKEKIDVTLNYVIKDFNGVVHLSESETLAVLDQKSITKEFNTESLPPGDYVLGTEIIYPDGVAVASSQFKVEPKFGIEAGSILVFIFIAAILAVFVVVFMIVRRYRKILKHVKGKKVKHIN